MATTRLLLVRHSEVYSNREMRYIGSRDEVLTEKGQIQAMQLAEALAILPVTAVYSSPLQRAYATAQAIARRHGLEVQLVNDLRESDFGLWEGLSYAEVIARSPQDAEQLRAWERDSTLAPPRGESLEAMYTRVCVAVEHLVAKYPDQTIVLVSHVGPLKAILCAALGVSIASAFRIFLDPATISVVDWRESYPVVRLVNSHAHLGWEHARWM